MDTREPARRALLVQGGAAAAGLALHRFPGPAHALALAGPARPGEAVLPWADRPAPNPVPERVGGLARWEQRDAYLTPTEQFFTVVHYGRPAVDARDWRLEVGGLVERPLTLTLDELRARPRREVVFTLECSGNHGFPWSGGLIGTARWAGTPLAPLLAEAGVREGGIEVVFWGADAGAEDVRGITMPQHFARSMSLADATDASVLLCDEMNGVPLPPDHGAPLRLIAPGWYGVANVKWLTRIEVRDTRLMNRFMARDYVTIREEPPAEEGGAPIAGVDVKIADGPWVPAALDRTPGEDAPFAWRWWSLDWGAPAAGEHAITSRSIDTAGRSQPAPDDPWIANKRTYWESTGQVTRRVLVGPPGR